MQKITTFLWFNKNALAAAKFYTKIFPRSKITFVSPMIVEFRLFGQDFMALNGGPMYKFTPAMSLYVSCRNQKEVDHYWRKLSPGAKSQRCGWITDRFGVSWQIIPEALGEYMMKDDSGRVMAAMLKMKKIDIEGLKRAYLGK